MIEIYLTIVMIDILIHISEQRCYGERIDREFKRYIYHQKIHEKTLEMRKHNQRQCFNYWKISGCKRGSLPVNPDDVNMVSQTIDRIQI